MRGTIVTGLLMAACLPTAAAAAEIGRIKAALGAASVVRGKAVSRAVAGQLLQVSDVLRTGPDGRGRRSLRDAPGVPRRDRPRSGDDRARAIGIAWVWIT